MIPAAPVPPPDVLAAAGPDTRHRLLVRAGGLALVAAGIALAVGISMATGTMSVLWCLPALVGAAVVGGTLARGDLAEVRVTRDGLDLVGRDGVVRTIPGEDIGGLAVAGRVVAGRLVSVAGARGGGVNGRVVVLDHEGRVLSARRSGWMKVDDVAALAGVGGVPWYGPVERAVPGSRATPPREMRAVQPPIALDDPPTAAALDGLRRRARRAGLALVATFGSGVAALVVLANVPEDAAGRGALGWIGGLGLVALVPLLPLAIVRAHEAGRVRRVLRTGPWRPVEAVVVSGLVTDATARAVGIVDPATGEAGWWTVETGGERGWLQGDDRAWFWYLPARRGAALAPPDRSQVALLGRSLLARRTLAEADTHVVEEARAWRASQAWAGRPWA